MSMWRLLNSLSLARAREGHACGMEGSLRCVSIGWREILEKEREREKFREVARRQGSAHGGTATVGSGSQRRHAECKNLADTHVAV